MKNQNVLRGVFMIVVALAFGLGALRYKIGTFGNAGPGLFPLSVSIILLVIGVMSVIRARFVDPVAMSFAVRNFGIILLSLFGFAAISRFVNMTVAIVFMVFFASLAASSYSWKRNLMVSAGLLVVAFALQRLLGLDLPLY